MYIVLIPSSVLQNGEVSQHQHQKQKHYSDHVCSCSLIVYVCVTETVPDCDTIVSCDWVGSALESKEMCHTDQTVQDIS